MDSLIKEIDAFKQRSGLSDFRIGFLAARNGRLVERLRNGGRVWPETEDRIRSFIAENSKRLTSDGGSS
jgi:hypothetical protein